MITNIKFSVIYYFNKNWERIIKLNCQEIGFYCKKKGNILVIKKNFAMCMIQMKHCDIFGFVKVYINITGVKNIEMMQKVVKFIHFNIIPNKCLFHSIMIDNITYVIDLKKSLMFESILLNQNVKYNQEKFPGLFIKIENTTCILFKSGKILIIGLKSLSKISFIKDKLYNMLNHSLFHGKQT